MSNTISSLQIVLLICRFINENGKFTKPEYFAPFGHGKRMCLGEPLARAELFIFFAVLVKNLKFVVVDEKQKPDPNNYSAGFTRSPNDFQIKIEPRL